MAHPLSIVSLPRLPEKLQRIQGQYFRNNRLNLCTHPLYGTVSESFYAKTGIVRLLMGKALIGTFHFSSHLPALVSSIAGTPVANAPSYSGTIW